MVLKLLKTAVFGNKFVIIRNRVAISNALVDHQRRKSEDDSAIYPQMRINTSEQLDVYRRKYPEFLPNHDWKSRDKTKEKLERIDMIRRRRLIQIPEFYVGSIMAVTASDSNSSSFQNKFVGICIDRFGTGMNSFFRLRNVIDDTGIEILYELYNPSLLKIEVLKLEKRLDDQLIYLRDCANEYSTIPFDTPQIPVPEGSEVPINDIKVPLKPFPWTQRWEIKNMKGIVFPTEKLPRGRLKIKWKHERANPWLPALKFDLMKRYRDTLNLQEQAEIYQAASLEMQSLPKQKVTNAKERRKVVVKWDYAPNP